MLSLMEHIQRMCHLISIDFDDNDAVKKLIEDKENFKSIVKALCTFLEHIEKLEHTCLAFIELKLIEKYFKQNILKEEMFESFLDFGAICMLYAANVLQQEHIMRYDIEISLKCADMILKSKLLWNGINNSEQFVKHLELFIDVLYKTINVNFGNTKLMSKFEIESLAINGTSDCDKKAIFLAKFVEVRSKNDSNDYFKLEVKYMSHEPAPSNSFKN